MSSMTLSSEMISNLFPHDPSVAGQIRRVISSQDGQYDLREINQAILDRRIKYDFTKVHSVLDPEFCSDRKIPSCGFNVIDLFCGAGGSSSGFRLAGFNLVGALDINKAAAETHELNFRGCKTIVGDITAIAPEEFHHLIGKPRVDIVIGSPPCQTFSSLSQGKIKSLGKDIRLDIRNYFYKYYLDYVSYFKPKVFLMENVPGFKTKYGGAIFEDYLAYVSSNLPEYQLVWAILDSQNYSVPQSRKRLFVCGYLKEFDFAFPEDNHQFCVDGSERVSVRDALLDLPVITDNWRLDMGYYSNDEMNPFRRIMRTGRTTVANNICRISNPEAKELFLHLEPGQRYIDLSAEKQAQIRLFDNFDSSVIQGRCHRLPLDDVSWTVIAHIGMDGYEYIHPTECRTLSVREAARLQSFTDDFVFVGNMREQYVQIGNAVPPLMSFAIADRIRKSLAVKS